MSTDMWLNIVMPIWAIISYIVPAVLTIFVIIKFYKLFKESNKIKKETNELLKELINKDG
ncbi:hypothetical protein [Bacillus sp. CRN 9]|uniref:hypothetical protein n=1 Tax=Cytobacillus horneckiae TaxID=549687 RepID=UPI0015623FDE|nr:hypothetical protein [Bacillus sp. CRN 9]